MPESRVYYVGTPEEVGHHAQPLTDFIDVRVAADDEVQRWARPGDLCIFFNEYFGRFRDACRQLKEQGCATLYAIDGILEWRNSWEFPEESACPWTMRPVLSHKVACIGRSQARVLESWGNLGRCEVVGIPRFDSLLSRKPRRRTNGEDFHILIMTAKNPGFTREQIERAKRSLADLKTWFERHPTVGSTRVQPIWRLTADLAEEIGAANSLKDTVGKDLATALQQVDAVITTPSTAMLEGMLQGLPVALLDYNNCPHYVPAAWSITAADHFDQVVPELLQPASARMLHQHTLLHDALECRTPATPRMVRLIEEMIRIGHECRKRNGPLRFPRRILHDEQEGHHLPEEQFDLRTLYPNHPAFADMDRTALQAECARLQLQLNHISRQARDTAALQHRIEAHPLLGPALRLRRKMRRVWGHDGI